MSTDDVPDVESGDLEVEPEDLPQATIAGYYGADEIVFDRSKGIVEMDGEKYHLSKELAELLLSED